MKELIEVEMAGWSEMAKALVLASPMVIEAIKKESMEKKTYGNERNDNTGS